MEPTIPASFFFSLVIDRDAGDKQAITDSGTSDKQAITDSAKPTFHAANMHDRRCTGSLHGSSVDGDVSKVSSTSVMVVGRVTTSSEPSLLYFLPFLWSVAFVLEAFFYLLL